MWIVPTDLSERYLTFVKRCLTDEAAFSTFKQANEYKSIVGMSEIWQSEVFMQTITENPLVLSKLGEFAKNDLIGNPELVEILDVPDDFRSNEEYIRNPHEYMNSDKVKKTPISPNTLRHIRTLCHLIKHFGNLDGKVISELGVGYGGLVFVVNTLYRPAAYHLIDLPDVQQFAKIYLDKCNIPYSLESPPESVDLFISEFCLSEFDDEELYSFYEKYVKHAKNVYLMMNLLDEDRKQKFITHMRYDFNVEYVPDDHGTGLPCYVLIGKRHEL